ncbi:MAG: hypothetical protein LKE40_00540 [Spirochaetia bacterium]|jgi:hypothetical protein|nr:hypothetical protein [Spirochaetia bacterium]
MTLDRETTAKLERAITAETFNTFDKKACLEIEEQIDGHKYFLGLDTHTSPSWEEAAESYFKTIFRPLMKLVCSWEFDVSFPKKEKSKLYFELVDHLYFERLKRPSITAEEAAEEYCTAYGDNRRGRLLVHMLQHHRC